MRLSDSLNHYLARKISPISCVMFSFLAKINHDFKKLVLTYNHIHNVELPAFFPMLLQDLPLSMNKMISELKPLVKRCECDFSLNNFWTVWHIMQLRAFKMVFQKELCI